MRDDVFWARLALRGRVGFGEAYVAGDLDATTSSALIALLAATSRRRASAIR